MKDEMQAALDLLETEPHPVLTKKECALLVYEDLYGQGLLPFVSPEDQNSRIQTMIEYANRIGREATKNIK